MDPADSAAAIKAACDAGIADPKLLPEIDEHGVVKKTFCNFFVQRIAKAVGYDGFADMTANEIFDRCSEDRQWSQVDASRAAIAAQQGLLVVAAHKHQPHGHVAVVYPGGGLMYSGKWQADAPVVASVGHENKICGANYAFVVSEAPPLYFLWTRKLS